QDLEGPACAQRDDGRLRRLRCAPGNLHQRLVGGLVDGDDVLAPRLYVRPLGILPEHQRACTVNSSFTLSVSAPVRLHSISGLPMRTCAPEDSPSPTMKRTKLLGGPALAARLVAVKRSLLAPGERNRVISSTICSSPLRTFRTHLEFT